MYLPKSKQEFLNTYYLKNELLEICKENDLPTNGSKENLVKYICAFIENRPITKTKNASKKNTNGFIPSLEKIIDVNYSNNEIHRTFFTKEIGEHFKYNVQFMNWMNENKGKKTYQEAVEMWKKLFLEKKSGKKYEIGKQFEYNQYTRDFFENNPEKSREDCIKCWNYKKQQKGKHIYEKEDLNIVSK
jgi:hypothetical protein